MIIDLEPFFNVEGLVKELDYTVDLSGEEFLGEKPFETPVKVKGAISNHSGIVSVEAIADFTMSVCCDRCAKPIEFPYDVEINHTLVASLNDEENDELLLVEDIKNFNLDELVSDDIFLDLPSKFLCGEDCKGLCPRCGKDLNDGPCSCQKEIDPRLAALTQLLDN
ncbi:MAG: DUF177 domain-containing protein [Clostridia bacterium]|nr:DUF177 domain-containing protein [Clostridia bacterium]